jgi:hypothetical protein
MYMLGRQTIELEIQITFLILQLQNWHLIKQTSVI